MFMYIHVCCLLAPTYMAPQPGQLSQLGWQLVLLSICFFIYHVAWHVLIDWPIAVCYTSPYSLAMVFGIHLIGIWLIGILGSNKQLQSF